MNGHSERVDAAHCCRDRCGLFTAAACAVTLLWYAVPAVCAQQASNSQDASGQAQTDEELAARALDRTLVTTGVVLLPAGVFEVEPSFLYLRNEQSAPGIFTDASGAVFVSETRVDKDSLNAAAQLRLGLPHDLQLELYLPYAYVRDERVTEVGLAPRADNSADISGLGDVNLAIAKTLMVEHAGRPNLVARLSWDTDTGRADRAQGLFGGSGFNEVRFSLLATKRQDPLVFLGGPYYEKSFREGGVTPGDKIGVTLGAALAASPETSLRVVLDQAFTRNMQSEGVTQPGSNQTIGTLTIGGSTTLAAGKLLDFTILAGLTRDAPKLGVGASLSMDFIAPWRR
jgi:hypothetical protein